MSYKGYQEFMFEIGAEMDAKGLHFDASSSEGRRKYVLDKGEAFISRLGRITFDEAKYICSKYEQGYNISKRQGGFNTGELKELAKIFIESDFNLHYVDYLFLGKEYIKQNTKLIEHIKKFDNPSDVIRSIGLTDIDTALEMIKKSGGIINNILLEVNDEDKKLCVDTHIKSGHSIFVVPKNLLTPEHVEYYFKDKLYGVSSFIDILDYKLIKKFINRENKIIAEIDPVVKYFSEVYKKTNTQFTLEHSMLLELLDGKIDLGNAELEKAISQLNIDKIYVAYNEYRIEQELDKRYEEDDF